MNGLPVEVIVILAGIALVVVVILALRFGRAILWVLALGVICVIVILALLAPAIQGVANFETARAATEAAKAAKAGPDKKSWARLFYPETAVARANSRCPKHKGAEFAKKTKA